MGRLCMGCYESYSSELSKLTKQQDEEGIYYECPKRSCKGNVIEIDDTLIPTIALLNEKGYFTESSCSGHMEEDTPTSYIKFNESVIKLDNIPKGYKLSAILGEDGSKQLIISKIITGQDSLRVFQDVLSSSLQLYAWALQLPYDDHFEIMYLEDLFGEHDGQERKESDNEGSIDPEMLKKDIKTSTIKMDEFIELLKNKSHNREEDE